MAWSDWFSVLGPHLAPELVHPKALESWRTRLQSWPARGPMVFEVRLGPAADSERLDVSFRLDDPSWAIPLDPCLAPHPCTEFLRHGWSRLGHPDPIPSVWLELDAPSAPEAKPPRPAGGSTPTGLRPLVIPRLRRAVDPGWLSQTLAPALGIAASDREDFRQGLHRAVEALPKPARVLYVFSLAARGEEGLRFETIDLPVAAMGATLDQVAGAAAAERIATAAGLVEGGERPHLSFDLRADGLVGKRLGLEVGFRRQPGREEGWDRLLTRWVEAGLCTEPQRRALLAWCGRDHLRSAFDRWPAGGRGHCVRCLSHFKVVTQPDRPPEVKAYLLCENVIAR